MAWNARQAADAAVANGQPPMVTALEDYGGRRLGGQGGEMAIREAMSASAVEQCQPTTSRTCSRSKTRVRAIDHRQESENGGAAPLATVGCALQPGARTGSRPRCGAVDS